MNFINAKELLDLCNEKKIKISEAMLQREVTHFLKDKDDVFGQMLETYKVMKECVNQGLERKQKSMGGLIGGEAIKLQKYRGAHGSLCGDMTSKAIAYAMGVLEVNASMGLIVAAPTAGSSGVLPGVLMAMQEEFTFTDEEIAHALFNAGAIGYLAALNATVSGAEGGCQAEVGTASSMAAGAATELMGGTPDQCLAAAGCALTNVLGLVCDPIRGLVESPCQSRNAMGASNALVSAEIALAGIGAIVPFDEVLSAMYEVGQALPTSLRETAKGGIAACPSVCQNC